MKKNPYFYALFALCCVFISMAGSCYAYEIFYSDAWTLETNGYFTFDPSVYAYFPDDYNSGSLNLYEGVYGTETQGDNIGGGSWPCWNYQTPTAMVGSPTADGTYSLKYTDSIIHDIFVFTFYLSGGVFSLNEPVGIFIDTPTTGSTITDTATTLDGNWVGIDPAIYHNITLYLNSNFIGEQSVAKIIPITTSSGTFSIPLSYFGISANGQWDLEGSATYANTQLSDMYITTDLISPTGYNLIFDVEGFHTPYTFTDFDTWYDTNVSNYDSPSTWASGMIGYLQPILEKIAEFGARLQDYLDTSTAWQRGNDIGSVFPVVNAYILKINIFFGGFPIAQFFQWGILIMIGMFAIKIILKLLSFIPVIGGGG